MVYSKVPPNALADSSSASSFKESLNIASFSPLKEKDMDRDRDRVRREGWS